MEDQPFEMSSDEEKRLGGKRVVFRCYGRHPESGEECTILGTGRFEVEREVEDEKLARLSIVSTHVDFGDRNVSKQPQADGWEVIGAMKEVITPLHPRLLGLIKESAQPEFDFELYEW